MLYKKILAGLAVLAVSCSAIPTGAASFFIHNIQTDTGDGYAMVKWHTTSDATSSIIYGDSPSGMVTVKSSDSGDLASKTHEVSLRYLVNGTTYFYKIISTDRSGRIYESDIRSLTVPLLSRKLYVEPSAAITKTVRQIVREREEERAREQLNEGPVVFNVNIYDIDFDTAQIDFETEPDTTAKVYYGLGFTQLSSSISTGDTRRTKHSASLRNLQGGTQYSIRISASDEEGVVTTSAAYEFVTSRITNIERNSLGLPAYIDQGRFLGKASGTYSEVTVPEEVTPTTTPRYRERVTPPAQTTLPTPTTSPTKTTTDRQPLKINPPASSSSALNRAEGLALIYKTLNKEVDTIIPIDPYSDVARSTWYAPYVYEAKMAGALSGSATIFKPTKSLSRAAALKMALIIGDVDLRGVATSLADVNNNNWYYSYVANAQQLGLLDHLITSRTISTPSSEQTTIGTKYTLPRYLGPGDTGTDVAELAEAMRDLGFYNGGATSDFSTELRRAISVYQLQKGLITNINSQYAGMFGPATMKLLKSESVAASTSTSTTGQVFLPEQTITRGELQTLLDKINKLSE